MWTVKFEMPGCPRGGGRQLVIQAGDTSMEDIYRRLQSHERDYQGGELYIEKGPRTESWVNLNTEVKEEEESVETEAPKV